MLWGEVVGIWMLIGGEETGPSVRSVFSFMHCLFDRRLSQATIKAYPAAISSCHEGSGDGPISTPHPPKDSLPGGVQRHWLVAHASSPGRSFCWCLRLWSMTPTSLWGIFLCRRTHSRQLCRLLWLETRKWVSWTPYWFSLICSSRVTVVGQLSDQAHPLFHRSKVIQLDAFCLPPTLWSGRWDWICFVQFEH